MYPHLRTWTPLLINDYAYVLSCTFTKYTHPLPEPFYHTVIHNLNHFTTQTHHTDNHFITRELAVCPSFSHTQQTQQQDLLIQLFDEL